LVEDRTTPWREGVASTTSRSRERMIRTTGFKLVNDRVTREYLLYDLGKDPSEMTDRAPDPAYAATLAHLKVLMDDHEAGCRFARQTVRMLELWEHQRKIGFAAAVPRAG
jgi:arylsulfatase A-like enzyme